jgi:hypothetical protein
MNEELGLKYEKDKRATFLKRDSQKQKAKIKKSRNAGDTDEEDSEDASCLYVLAHPEKCGFNTHAASCGHVKNALMALPTVFA